MSASRELQERKPKERRVGITVRATEVLIGSRSKLSIFILKHCWSLKVLLGFEVTIMGRLALHYPLHATDWQYS